MGLLKRYSAAGPSSKGTYSGASYKWTYRNIWDWNSTLQQATGLHMDVCSGIIDTPEKGPRCLDTKVSYWTKALTAFLGCGPLSKV